MVSQKIFGTAQLLFTLVVVGWLGLQYGKGEMSSFYFTLYSVMGLMVLLYTFIAWFVDFGKSKGASRSPFGMIVFLAETSSLRPLSAGWLPYVVWVSVTVLIGFLVTGGGVSFYDPIITGNPYENTALSQDVLSQYGVFQNLAYGALIPGLLEEGLVLMGWSATAGLLLLLLYRTFKVRPGPALYYLVSLASIAVWSYLFAVAHGRYGGNQEQLIYAAGFSFVMGVLNLTTGHFLSWLPHMVHNAGVIVDTQFSLGLLSTVAVQVLPSAVLWRFSHE